VDSKSFCYWLQGFFELGGGEDGLTLEQVRVIKNHLALVFHHDIDPAQGGNGAVLQDIHDGKPTSTSGKPEHICHLPGYAPLFKQCPACLAQGIIARC
jgi:hypothetical protein